MSRAVVIGNGESRRAVDLETLRPNTLIGCNAVHRDCIVDHLICCDRRMADEAVENPQTKNTLIYVRPSWSHYFKKILKNKNIRPTPNLPYQGEYKKDDPDHWGSGGYAVLLAAQLEFTEIELIGFDLYPINLSVNNIYKGTKNYSRSNSQPIDYSYWVYQINRVFMHYSSQKFVIRNHRDWKMPTEWQKNNVEFVAL
jgi:hypothetical protein